jgi:ATP-binding protein involved in chromosome partitioning
MMKKIPVMSLKGGTGKSSCTAQIALALRDLGNTIGLLDLDIHGPNLPLSLGLEKAPPLEVDTKRQVILPNRIDGYQLMSMASHFGEATRILWSGEDKLDLARQLLTGVIAWDNLDYLMIDTPPSQSEEIMGLLDYIEDIFGVVIICQPTDFSQADTERALDLLRDRAVPIIGIVANMDGAICPKCGERFYPFLTKRADVEDFAGEYNIPFLASIPQTSSFDRIKPLFLDLAGKVIKASPVKLPRHEKRKRFKRETLKAMLEGRDV